MLSLSSHGTLTPRTQTVVDYFLAAFSLSLRNAPVCSNSSGTIFCAAEIVSGAGVVQRAAYEQRAVPRAAYEQRAEYAGKNRLSRRLRIPHSSGCGVRSSCRPGGRKGRKEKFEASAMNRVAAGAHLPTPWLFEPAKTPRR